MLAFLSSPAFAAEEDGDDDESRELLLLFDREDVVVSSTRLRVSVQKAPSIASVIGASEIRALDQRGRDTRPRVRPAARGGAPYSTTAIIYTDALEALLATASPVAPAVSGRITLTGCTPP